MNKKYLFLILLIGAIVSCKKEKNNSYRCAAIQKAILSNDVNLMKTEINLMCDEINSMPAPGGTRMPREMQDDLVKALNKCVTAENLCYFCIDTNPPQSEIKVSFNGVTRIIDISTQNQKLVFVNMHD